MVDYRLMDRDNHMHVECVCVPINTLQSLLPIFQQNFQWLQGVDDGGAYFGMSLPLPLVPSGMSVPWHHFPCRWETSEMFLRCYYALMLGSYNTTLKDFIMSIYNL